MSDERIGNRWLLIIYGLILLLLVPFLFQEDWVSERIEEEEIRTIKLDEGLRRAEYERYNRE